MRAIAKKYGEKLGVLAWSLCGANLFGDESMPPTVITVDAVEEILRYQWDVVLDWMRMEKESCSPDLRLRYDMYDISYSDESQLNNKILTKFGLRWGGGSLPPRKNNNLCNWQ